MEKKWKLLYYRRVYIYIYIYIYMYGLYLGTLGLYWDNGKENGICRDYIGVI